MRISFRTELLAAAGAIIALVVLATFNEAGARFLTVPRLLLTMIVLLGIPGYFWQIALFPRVESLENWARAALVVSLSAASIPFLTLVVDGALWVPLRFETLLLSVSLWAGLGAGIAYVRRRPLARDEQFALQLPAVQIRESTRQDWLGSILIVVVVSSMLVAFSALALTYAVPGESQQFTEFYLLGSDGLAEAYPSSLRLAAPVTFNTSVINREERESRFSVVMMMGNDVIGQSDSIEVFPGEYTELSIAAIPVTVGNAQPLDLLLMREGTPEPYRRLRLWVDVEPAGAQ